MLIIIQNYNVRENREIYEKMGEGKDVPPFSFI